MHTDINNWYIEFFQESGSSIGVKIQKKLHEEQTPFQKIEIYDTEHFGHLMTIDGCFMVTQRDNFIYHEMMSHPVLFNHHAPSHVVIVGGGDCGTMREVAKHECVRRITQVEIDERVTRLAEQYFPELCVSNHDPRVCFEFTDAIAWMNEVEAGSVDIIIIDSTDPVGPAEGLFSAPFYRACYRALSEHGLLVQQSESPLVHLERVILPMHQTLRSESFKDTQTLFFPQPTYPTGWWSGTMASKNGPIQLHRDQDARNLTFPTLYYDYAVHLAAVQPPRFIRDRLARTFSENG